MSAEAEAAELVRAEIILAAAIALESEVGVAAAEELSRALDRLDQLVRGDGQLARLARRLRNNYLATCPALSWPFGRN